MRNPNDKLAAQKLELEIQSLEAQLNQLTQTKRKLELEVDVLASQVGKFGSFARIFWPVISALLTIIIGLTAAVFTYRSQDDQIAQKKKEIFLTAIHDAADEQKGPDTRIAGLWSLGNYWDSEYSVLAANVVTAAIGTGADSGALAEAELKQPIRLAAAEVIGSAIAGNPYQFNEAEHQRAKTISRLLYGVGQTGEVGVLTRLHLYLVQRRAQLVARGVDISAIDLKIAAAKEAIRKNWECLEGANLRGHDLTGIRLYEAEMPYATLAEASLKGADLHLANLYGADLENAKDWRDAMVNMANIKALQHAPDGFEPWALDHGAVEMNLDSWSSWRRNGSPKPKDWDAWRKGGFRVDSRGSPASQ